MKTFHLLLIVLLVALSAQVCVGQEEAAESAAEAAQGTPVADAAQDATTINEERPVTPESETESEAASATESQPDEGDPASDATSQEEEKTADPPVTPPPTPATTTTNTARAPSDPDFDPHNEDWGTYYDPQNVFCGQYDCYKILGFDYESFGKEHPTTSVITKRYRALSRVWHPDKSKHKNAKERFVKISRAYEVLTNVQQRKEYDELRYDIEKYYHKYGTSVFWSYAPKSDTTIVIIFITVISNLASWYAQKHRWQLVADRLIKAAVEDWSPSQGGSPESKQLREQAQGILAEREKAEEASKSTNVTNGSKKRTQKGGKKVSGKEKKKLEQVALLPIIQEIVYAMDDFGGGFHKPTWEDLLIVSLARLPVKIAKETAWFAKYWLRRLQKLELNDDEKQVLTQRAVGPLAWDAASEEEQAEMITRELWVTANLAEWSDEQEFKKLSTTEQKEYRRLKKRGHLDKED